MASERWEARTSPLKLPRRNAPRLVRLPLPHHHPIDMSEPRGIFSSWVLRTRLELDLLLDGSIDSFSHLLESYAFNSRCFHVGALKCVF